MSRPNVRTFKTRHGLLGSEQERFARRLADTDVDAMRTARAQGASVTALARRFGFTGSRCGRRQVTPTTDGVGVEHPSRTGE